MRLGQDRFDRVFQPAFAVDVGNDDGCFHSCSCLWMLVTLAVVYHISPQKNSPTSMSQKRHALGGTHFCPHTRGRNSLGCGALFLLRPSQRACKKQTAAPAPLRLFLPSPWGQNGALNRARGLAASHTPSAPFPCMCPTRTRMSSGWDFLRIMRINCYAGCKGCA